MNNPKSDNVFLFIFITKGGIILGLKQRTYSTLLVSASESFIKATKDILPPSLYNPVVCAGSVSDAKRHLSERSFDFVIISSPLPDEFGSRFAIDCSTGSTVVLILFHSDLYAEMRDKVSERGVYSLPVPTSKQTMLQALDWMASTRERLRGMEKKASTLEERMEEIRLLNRAKLVLISEMNFTEDEAHHYIERHAMDNSITKKDAAKAIIRMYE